MMDINQFGRFRGEALHQLGELLDATAHVIRRRYPEVGREGSQGDEDKILAALLPEVGRYLDIGAGEPKECSNTWRLYEKGWSGILVEPLPQFWYPLLRERPRDQLFPVAAHKSAGMAQLRVSGTVSSLRPDWSIETQTVVMVETMTVDQIVRASTFPFGMEDINFISIDAEGSETWVLEGINWNNIKPPVLCIEFRKYHPIHLGSDESDCWEQILLDQGYRRHAETDWNRIYVL